MPTREDIVEWMEDAAKVIEELHDKYLHNDCVVEIALFKHRAAQVAAMRCETCKKQWDDGFCPEHGQYKAPDDGCFSHEQKPAG